MSFHVDSEVGRLRQVIVHRPGLELTGSPRTTSTGCSSTTSCGPTGPRGARRVRRGAARPASWCTTSTSCSPRPSTIPEARDVRPRPAVHTGHGGPGAGRAAARAGRASRRRQLAGYLIGGITKADLAPCSRTASRGATWRDDFVLTPLPNHLFQRDNSAWIYGGVSINPMAKAARQARDGAHRGPSTGTTRCSPTPFDVWYGGDDARPPAGHDRGRRHPRARQRRRADRHGRADHPHGRGDAGPRAVRRGAARPR